MKEIGGFFELELPIEGNNSFQSNALLFNSGSSALEFYLLHSNYDCVWVPFFTCQSVIETIKKVNKDIVFYNLHKDFSPNLKADEIGKNDLVIYNDYFGVNRAHVKTVQNKFPNVIIDAAQSFFYTPELGSNAFNSLRKFFGVPDGGLLFAKFDANLEERYKNLGKTAYEYDHLIERLEGRVSKAYQSYKKNERLILANEVGIMSKLTKRLFANIDLDLVKSRRRSNFMKLHSVLGESNLVQFQEDFDGIVPMCYPFLLPTGERLKQRLIHNKIYVPTYWPSISKNFEPYCEFEFELVRNLVSLPIDQRYTEKDMDHIIETIEVILHE